MDNILIVEKYPTNFDYKAIFPFEFTKTSLVDEKQDKVLKRDVSLDIAALKEQYRYIITVGKEPSKYIANISSVTQYQGFLMEDKYLSMLNPMAVKMRPSLQSPFDKSINDIIRNITGEDVLKLANVEVQGLQSENDILKYLRMVKGVIDNKSINTIALDTETSSLYAREGYVLGICMSHKEKQGVYMDSLYITEEVVELLQDICNSCTTVFHNKKFDDKMLKYHFGITTPNWEDTLLEHYVLDETEGSHGLKELALKYTDLGDYDAELDDFKTKYCARHKVLKRDFSYDLIPFGIMKTYAATDPAATLELHNKFYPTILENKS